MTARNSRGGIKKTGKNKGGSGVVSPAGKKINYNFDSTKETASQYHARIGQERGDSAAYVKGMQRGAKTAFSERGLDANKLNAAGTAIPVSDLTPAAPVPMPSTPIPTDPGNVVGANNAGLATASNGMLTFDATSNQLVPNTQGTTPTATDNFSSLFNQYMGMQEAPPNTADLYAKEAKDAQLKQKQESVNSYTAQLNSIVAKSQADQLRLEGQGRGITDVIIGGQQAQINREAAIAALPVQAQLAAAQGDLEMAQLHVDKMFQIKSQDALAQYQYKGKIVDAVYNFATAGEQRRLDALKAKEDRAYDMQKTNMSIANDWAKTALEYGQSGIASKLMALDTASPTFSQDFAALTSRVQKPAAPTTSDWELKDVNGQSSWVNRRTQEIKPVGGTNSPTTLSYEDNAKFNSTPEAKAIKDATKYAEAVKNYELAINTYGTGELYGKGKGALNEAYSSLVGATKDYYTLGTYDNGVQKLIALGIPEPSIWGLKSTRLGGLDSALTTAKDTIDRNVSMLESTRYGSSVEFQNLVKEASKVVAPPKPIKWELFQKDDLLELQSLGVMSQTTTTESFDPSNFYKK